MFTKEAQCWQVSIREATEIAMAAYLAVAS
jgi:hypothetical protein